MLNVDLWFKCLTPRTVKSKPDAAQMKQRFAEYLQRVDGKQSLVDDFA